MDAHSRAQPETGWARRRINTPKGIQLVQKGQQPDECFNLFALLNEDTIHYKKFKFSFYLLLNGIKFLKNHDTLTKISK